MPSGQPFTALCQAVARSSLSGRADLHIHTTHSDGTYTPAQVVELARRSGLKAVAVTDHDTLEGVPHAQAAAAGSRLEVIPGVEISAEYHGRELHLLAYFVRLEDQPLRAALEHLRQQRLHRFWHMVERLRQRGVSVDEEEVRAHVGAGVLGRRNLADYLVKTRRAATVREAFSRYLQDGGAVAVPKVRLDVAEALALVRGAGGVASWAHPAYDCTREGLVELRQWGLQALEVEYPGTRAARRGELRRWAGELGLAITGGSDCHGPEPWQRAIGAQGITTQELAVLRQRAAG